MQCISSQDIPSFFSYLEETDETNNELRFFELYDQFDEAYLNPFGDNNQTGLIETFCSMYNKASKSAIQAYSSNAANGHIPYYDLKDFGSSTTLANYFGQSSISSYRYIGEIEGDEIIVEKQFQETHITPSPEVGGGGLISNTESSIVEKTGSYKPLSQPIAIESSNNVDFVKTAINEAINPTDNVYIVPAIFINYYRNKENQRDTKLKLEAAGNTILLATGIGELSSAVSIWRAAVAITDVATAVGGLIENEQITSDQQVSDFISKFNKTMAWYQLTRVAYLGGKWTLVNTSPETASKISIATESFKIKLKSQFVEYLQIKKIKGGSEAFTQTFAKLETFFNGLGFKAGAATEAEIFGLTDKSVVNFTDFKFPAQKGYTDVIIHYHDGQYWIRQAGASQDEVMSMEKLAEIINNAPAENTVRLLSCNNNEGALMLAKYTNRPFYASDGWVDINAKGDVASENSFYKFANGEKTEESLAHVTKVDGEVVRLGDSEIGKLLNQFYKGDVFTKSDIFKSGGKVLSLGEGDFSFAKSVAIQSSSEELNRLTVSEYRNLSEVIKQYPDGAAANIKFLEEKGIKVMGGIDATQLSKNFNGEKFGSIVFQFPFAGGSKKVKATELLLKDFLKNSSKFIEPNGKIFISTPKFWSTRIGIHTIAEGTDFQLVEVRGFKFEDFPGYIHKITSEDESAQSIKDSYTFIFSLK